MNRNLTPPPLRARLRTPPAPLHGPGFNDWNPFEPRRSSRVAAQRPDGSSPRVVVERKRGIGRSRTPPPTQSLQANLARTSSKQTFSPPSSSSSPEQLKNISVKKTGEFTIASSASSSFVPKLPQSSPPTSDTEIEETPRKSKSKSSVSLGACNMLPTPAKTPHKRNVVPQPQPPINSTARVLFRGTTVEEAMPAPKKSRNGGFGFGIDPFYDENYDDPNGSIQIYEDSKERIPTFDPTEDNPFITKAPAAEASVNQTGRRSRRSKKERDTGIDAEIDHEKGVLYNFRGKKVFIRFDDGQDDEEQSLSDLEIRRRAGISPKHKLARVDLKPRLLFPTDHAVPSHSAGRETNIVDQQMSDDDIFMSTTATTTTDAAANLTPSFRNDRNKKKDKNKNKKKPIRPTTLKSKTDPPVTPSPPSASRVTRSHFKDGGIPSTPPNGGGPIPMPRGCGDADEMNHFSGGRDGRSSSVESSRPMQSTDDVSGRGTKRHGETLASNPKRTRDEAVETGEDSEMQHD